MTMFHGESHMLACFRFMVRWGMKREKGPNKVKHPALESVRTAVLNGDEDCLVLWGLEESDTQICCKNIANHLIKKENGLVKVFRCEDMPRSDLYPVVCKALNVESFSEFIECMPSSGAWLIFDAVDMAMCPFFDDLIHRAKQSSKFRILLVVHDVECAYHLLRARPVNQGRVVIIHPLECCIWQEQHIRDCFAASNEDIIQNAISAGCPRVYRRRSEVFCFIRAFTQLLTYQ